MLKQNPTYIYQFKNSSNYFFRISLNFFKKMGYHHVDGHFVASLKTSDYEDAKFLALYIKRMIDKEFSIEAKKFSYEPMGSGCFEEFTHSVAEIGNNLDVKRQRATVQKMLREKFKRLYQTGLQLINEGYGHEPGQIITLSKEQKTHLEQKIQNANEYARSVIDEPTAREPVTLSAGNTGLNNKLGKAHDDIFLNNANANALMLSNLMDMLMLKARSYDANEVTEELTPSRLIEFASALSEQRKIKADIENELAGEAPRLNKDYTIENQLSLFLAEKQQELDDKTINGYRAKFAVFFEIIDKDFDVRKFSKLEVQKIKSRLIERNANETKGADTKKMSAKTINMYLSVKV